MRDWVRLVLRTRGMRRCLRIGLRTSVTRRWVRIALRRLARSRFLVATGVLLLPAPLAPQGVLGYASTSLRWVQLQPVMQDTVSAERVETAPDGSLVFQGRPVSCLPGLGCTFYRASPAETAVAGTEDVSLSLWGLGIRGLSVTTLLRARFRLAGELVWPRSDDAFDALLAYAELQRGTLRLRGGRQETLSGLGFQGYDGLEVRWTPTPRVAGDVYAGRSLARGLSEPGHTALASLEDLLVDRAAYVLGGSVRGDLGAESEVGASYQRELWSDRSGLLQERASLSAHTGRLAPLRIEGALDWDLAFGQLGKSHVTLGYPLPAPGVELEATLRRYLPYFPLSTIWGFFSPVPYHEAVLAARFAPAVNVGAQVVAGWRSYGETDKEVFLSPLTDKGWHVEASLATPATPDWSLSGRARVEWGVGAFLSSIDAQARWRAREGLEVGLLATAFQQILEFRVGDGRVWGSGLSVGADLPWRARLDGGAVLYRHGARERGAESPWAQTRAWTTLIIPFGTPPASSARTLRR